MAERKSPGRKTVSSRKPSRRPSRRRSAKPKVRLSSRRVYALSIFIVLVCAASLALSVILTSPELEKQSEVSHKTQETVQKKESPLQVKPVSPVTAKTTEASKVATTKKTAASSTAPASSLSSAKTSSATEAQKTTASSATVTPGATPAATPAATLAGTPSSSATAKASSATEASSATVTAASSKSSGSPAASSADRFPQIVPAVNGAVLTFVFDDGGHNIAQLQKFIDLPFPVDIAVLPRLAHSAECASLIRSSGRHQLMLHQPMQALNPKVNPGAGAILPSMHVQEIMQTLRDNIAEIGPIAGLNNHEGSAICENEIQIGAVLDEAKAQGIFFLDSRTTAQTRAPQAALERGMTIYERDIFLDNEKTRENILKELYKGLTIANKKGRVIMIGHVWSADILPAVLTEVYPELVKKGYTFALVR